MAIIPIIVTKESVCNNIMLALMIIQGTTFAFLQNALYGVAGVSMHLTNNLMLGVGIGAVAMNVIRIIFKASVDSERTSDIVFFTVSAAYLLFCTILSIYFVKDYNKFLLKLFTQTDSFIVNLSENRVNE